jgi:hypothetical protein
MSLREAAPKGLPLGQAAPEWASPERLSFREAAPGWASL